MNYGYVRVGGAVPNIRVADCAFNVDQMLTLFWRAEAEGVQYLAFPELGITAYTCADLFHQEALIASAETELRRFLRETARSDILAVLGVPVVADNQLFNCAAVVQSGRILGVVPKTHIPGYKEFYEERWFSGSARRWSPTVRLCGQEAPFGEDLIFHDPRYRDAALAVEICEDLWAPIPPSCYTALGGATILVNISASNEILGKMQYRQQLVSHQSAACIAGYVYVSSGVDESTTDLVFSGDCMIAEYGAVLARGNRFSQTGQLVTGEIDTQKLANDRFKTTTFMESYERRTFRRVTFTLRDVTLGMLSRHIPPHPFVPSDPSARDQHCEEIFAIQTAGLAKRLVHTGLKHALIGVSGGLDSTLALLVTAKTFDQIGIPRENIVAVTMPGFGTSGSTYDNAVALIGTIGATFREIDITKGSLQEFQDIGHDPDMHDTTYENVQARERTEALMNLANKLGGLVIGTGDLSELALGWCTYNGDHMSMYAVNVSIPKTLVRYLVQWVADNMVEKSSQEVLEAIVATPISPELLPPDATGAILQRTEEIIGPYDLHDFFLYHTIRYGAGPKKLLFLSAQAFGDRYEPGEMRRWLSVFYRRFFGQQFKRSCLPDGPKVGTISLSPRGDWRMPSDAVASMWLRELDELEDAVDSREGKG
jgi:NAD+ synthase (glutamine-hydrolysing)